MRSTFFVNLRSILLSKCLASFAWILPKLCFAQQPTSPQAQQVIVPWQTTAIDVSDRLHVKIYKRQQKHWQAPSARKSCHAIPKPHTISTSRHATSTFRICARHQAIPLHGCQHGAPSLAAMSSSSKQSICNRAWSSNQPMHTPRANFRLLKPLRIGTGSIALRYTRYKKLRAATVSMRPASTCSRWKKSAGDARS